MLVGFSKLRPSTRFDFYNLYFSWLLWLTGALCIIVPNFMKIDQTIAEISQFFYFQDGSHCHIGFSNIKNIYQIL